MTDYFNTTGSGDSLSSDDEGVYNTHETGGNTEMHGVGASAANGGEDPLVSLEGRFESIASRAMIPYFQQHETTIRNLAQSLQVCLQTYLVMLAGMITILVTTLLNSEMFQDFFRGVIKRVLQYRQWVCYVKSQNLWTLDLSMLNNTQPTEALDKLTPIYREILEEYVAEMEGHLPDGEQ